MSAHDAVKQFSENLELFGGDAIGQPEKYNFYAGLLNLARSMEEIERQNAQILAFLGSILARMP